jgi:hypothetical protein
MQQGEIDAGSAGHRRLGNAARPGLHCRTGGRDQQYHIRLAAALASPTRGGGIRHIDYIIIQLFDAIEPGGGMSAGPHIPHQLGSARARELRDQASRQIGDVDFDAVGHNGKYMRALLRDLLAIAAPQPPGAKPSERQRKTRRLRCNDIEGRVWQQQQLAVAQGKHGGTALLVQQPAGLSDQFAALDMRGQPRVSRGLDA